jgi:hypothetical protein
MADDLGSESDTTFREGGALHKLATLARNWERRARAAERARRAHRLERAAWAFAGGLGALAVRHFLRLPL